MSAFEAPLSDHFLCQPDVSMAFVFGSHARGEGLDASVGGVWEFQPAPIPARHRFVASLDTGPRGSAEQ
ncbi:hypothetical protein HN371_17005 [Candidatus Poribacteria bacterium]|jgi:hypothetical protein|nr:hypothetical protein [Candidatus Poribacteria bacterium]MBT5533985.1 hypothetical protein [Candidatus Poribacteria bacterium]MBT5713904.1 hypothetical protein [Candidatus Poribacteria bacterium]MBT7808720.1 hypothetical protein [Candidatus Poribacteria bacterium]